MLGVVAVDTPAEAKRRRAVSRAPAASTYAPPSAALVVDAKSGAVLHESNADAQRYPASVTKVMTLYLLFEDIERGAIRLDSQLAVSARSAAQAPSKLGLRPGETIAVEHAIKALVTKSANDVAVAVAENLSGSEDAFAERMTRKARALGMSRTVFRNASGLPDPDQHTTARDLATLGRSIQDRFPTLYRYFATRSFTYRGRTHGNHNKLLGRVDAVDGIKTGYIRASGFNLLTSAKQDGRHIVAVVLGGRTGSSRDAHMRGLIEAYLPRASRGPRSAPLVAENPAPEAAGPGRRLASLTPVPVPVPAAQTPPAAATGPAIAATTTPPVAILRVRPAVVAASTVPTPAPVRLAAAPASAAPAPHPAPPQAADVPKAAAAPSPAPQPRPTDAGAVAARRVAMAMAGTTPQALRWVVGPQPTATGTITPSVLQAYAGGTTPGPGLPREARAAAEPTAEAPTPRAAAEAVPAPAPVPTTVAAPPRLAMASLANQSVAGTKQVAAIASVPQRSGWIIQIGATETESDATELLERAREKLGRAAKRIEPFTETVNRGDTTLYRARFAGFDERSAQAACRLLKNSEMACFAIRN